MWNSHPPQGTTLIELLIAIVVAGIVISGMIPAYQALVMRSADPQVQLQSVLIAKSLMEEVLLKPYLDPTTSTACPAASGSRTNFNNVCDYNGYVSNPVVDQQGNAVFDSATRTDYSASVTVVPAANAGALGTIPSGRALKITVTVSNPLARSITLTAWRTCYESTICSSL